MVCKTLVISSVILLSICLTVKLESEFGDIQIEHEEILEAQTGEIELLNAAIMSMINSIDEMEHRFIFIFLCYEKYFVLILFF